MNAAQRAGMPGTAFAVVLLMTATLAGGCRSAEQTTKGPHPAPTSAGECNDMPLIHGDPGFVLGFDWQNGDHGFDDDATIYVCASDVPSNVTLDPLPDGVTARPSTVTLVGDGTGRGVVIPIRLRVAPEATGALSVTQTFDGGGGGGPASGPKVVAEAGAWHLEPAN